MKINTWLIKLKQIMASDRVLTRPIDRVAYANDASFYRLIPQAIVQPINIAEIQALFRFSHAYQIPMTFRAAGTSLSGQAITSGILVDISKYWRGIKIEKEGKQVRLQPGIIGGTVNAMLRSYARKIGPDPASINACMMGGILANNASGMCCGVNHNAYHTLESMQMVLPNGFFLDTNQENANRVLEQEMPELVQGLYQLKQQIEENDALKNKIRAKYQTKNTTGYSLNALLDFKSPSDILSHLMIGSEGTLGFIAEAVLKTVPDARFKLTGLLFFASLQEACQAVLPLTESGVAALEIMDRKALQSVENQAGVPDTIKKLPPAATALLLEYHSTEPLIHHIPKIQSLLSRFSLVYPPLLTQNPIEQAQLWKIRKGMFPSIGATRKQGTSVIIEDIVFPLDSMASGVTELQALFHRHGYSEGIIFGHAKEGNLHFVITQSFHEQRDIERYDQFIRDVVDMVVGRFNGALKAEHGTGRNMAPFVETEWGAEAYEIMKSLKALLDPTNLLNPGVIINPDPEAHLRYLKPLTVVDPEIDRCIECGFCEPRCPSRDLSLTPRQRIVVRREIRYWEQSESQLSWLKDLQRDYPYQAVETCATDGLCATACPVSIDTGLLMKRIRHEDHTLFQEALATWCVAHFSLVEWGLRQTIRLGHRLPSQRLNWVIQMAEKWFRQTLPKWPRVMPSVITPLFSSHTSGSALLFTSCITRNMGSCGHKKQTQDLLVQLSKKAGLVLKCPNTTGFCCGLPFSSKGYQMAYREMANQTIQQLWRWSEQGRLPIVIDNSPCAQTIKDCQSVLSPENCDKFNRLILLDAIEYVHDDLLPKLKPRRLPGNVLLHPVCSVIKMGLVDKLRGIAEVCSNEVTVPIQAGCCGFAGDRGLLFPELTVAAMAPEVTEIQNRQCTGYYASSRTCEIALSGASHKNFISFLYLLDEACNGVY